MRRHFHVASTSVRRHFDVMYPRGYRKRYYAHFSTHVLKFFTKQELRTAIVGLPNYEKKCIWFVFSCMRLSEEMLQTHLIERSFSSRL